MTNELTKPARLYTYFRSSAAFRTRIALNLKGLAHDLVPVHLLRCEQSSEVFRLRNPQALVPVLEYGEVTISQSLAIMELLDELHPERPLLPKNAVDRARVRSMALAIACEIHPLNNLRVLNFLTEGLSVSMQGKTLWYRHWVESGLEALEKMVVSDGHREGFCHGDIPTMADCCLVPQIFNAQRFGCQLDQVPTLMAIHQRCMELDAFKRAQPSNQPDYENPTR